MSSIRLQTNDGFISTISVQRSKGDHEIVAAVDGKKHTIEIMRIGKGRGVIRYAGRIFRIRSVRVANDILAWVGNRNHTFQIVETRTSQGKSHAAAAKKELAAPMPGTVLRIHLGSGDAFQPHQPIIIMESMKMELTLSSPVAGTIRDVLCKEGELVPLGHVLVRLDIGDEA